MFIDSKSISEFSKKLGYKHKITANQSGVNDRLKNLNLDINDIKRLQNHVAHLKKEELFNKRSLAIRKKYNCKYGKKSLCRF